MLSLLGTSAFVLFGGLSSPPHPMDALSSPLLFLWVNRSVSHSRGRRREREGEGSEGRAAFIYFDCEASLVGRTRMSKQALGSYHTSPLTAALH